MYLRVQITASASISDLSPEFERVSADEFAQLILDITSGDDFLRENLSIFDDYNGFQCWVTTDRQSGYAVTPTAELVNVFSLCSNGANVVTHATDNHEDLHLNCFAGFLETFYAQYGFTPLERVPNWTEGKPDVVIMQYSKEARITDQSWSPAFQGAFGRAP